MLVLRALSVLVLALSTHASSFFSGGSKNQHILVGDDDALRVPGENPLVYCNPPEEYLLEIEKVDLQPNPPEAGKNLTIVATGTLKEPVEKGGYIVVQVKYGLITLIKQTLDLCDQVINVNLKCPLDKGPLKLTKEVTLPGHIPIGNYKALAHAFTKDDDEITCLEADVHFGPS